MAGASEDLSRVYFVSTEELPGAGQNSEEDEASEGEPNLYLDRRGRRPTPSSRRSAKATWQIQGARCSRDRLRAATRAPRRATRVSADGRRIVFQSRAPLTGFDNTDAASGKADVEVFAYEAGGELLCVSCNPAGRGRAGGNCT